MKYRYRHIPEGCTSSAYDSVCRACNAPIGHYCVGRRTGRTTFFPHRSRKPRPKPCTIEREREHLPDLSGWWREMAKYEGQHAQPRPAGLVLP